MRPSTVWLVISLLGGALWSVAARIAFVDLTPALFLIVGIYIACTAPVLSMVRLPWKVRLGVPWVLAAALWVVLLGIIEWHITLALIGAVIGTGLFWLWAGTIFLGVVTYEAITCRSADGPSEAGLT